jgi:SAM-dependent methyltransferase
MRQDATTAALSRSFGEVAQEYDRLRPRPSEDALDFLVPEGATAALEFGAGTGILTRLLAERITHVTAVEPDDRMRGVLASGDAARAGAEILAGTAEALPVADASFDVVIAQSAWHWVDEQRAIPEVARVLRPGGELTAEQQADIDARRRRRHVVDVDAAGPSPFGKPETRLFAWTRPMSKSDLVGLACTYSAVIAMDGDARRGHLDAMTRFLETDPRFAGEDSIPVPMRSYCWRATRP